MPDLLREQFPHFRPIVEAFGYQNLEFEGWEADDVIATLATLADEAGVKTCVVSTDRDAFQLVSENVCLMMTPRGVADVQVYTPERVEARYGIRPPQIPDFIGLKGDTSDNIPGIPGIGDKTAGQLIAQYGSLEGRRRARGGALARAIEGDRRERGAGARLRSSSRRCGAISTSASIPRPRPAATRPLRAQGDLPAVRVPRRCSGAVDTLDEALPAAERPAGRVGDGLLARRRPDRGFAVASASPPMRSASPWRPETGEVVLASLRRPASLGPRRRRARREGAAARRAGCGRHDDRRVPHRSRPRRVRARRPHGRVRRRARARSARRGGDGCARAARRGGAPPGRAARREGRPSAAPTASTATSSFR